VWCEDRYTGVRGGFCEPVVVGEQGGELRAEQPCCCQVDRVQGAQQPVGLDDGGADDVLVDLDVLENVKQPQRCKFSTITRKNVLTYVQDGRNLAAKEP
jgi:hypothetical protein